MKLIQPILFASIIFLSPQPIFANKCPEITLFILNPMQASEIFSQRVYPGLYTIHGTISIPNQRRLRTFIKTYNDIKNTYTKISGVNTTEIESENMKQKLNQYKELLKGLLNELNPWNPSDTFKAKIQGSNSESLDWINEVRGRAGLPQIDSF